MRVVCRQRLKNPESQASWALTTSPQDLKGLNHKQNPNPDSKIQNKPLFRKKGKLYQRGIFSPFSHIAGIRGNL